MSWAPKSSIQPQKPASVITKRLAATTDQTLSDTILDVPFRYATEGFSD